MSLLTAIMMHFCLLFSKKQIVSFKQNKVKDGMYTSFFYFQASIEGVLALDCWMGGWVSRLAAGQNK